MMYNLCIVLSAEKKTKTKKKQPKPMCNPNANLKLSYYSHKKGFYSVHNKFFGALFTGMP